MRRRLSTIALIFILIILAIGTLTINIAPDRAIQFAVVSTFFAALSSVATLVQAREAQRQREDAERPEVGVFFQPRNRLMYCVIQNFGVLPARNIEIQFIPSPKMHDGRSLNELSAFSKPLPFLPPNEKYWRHIGSSPDALKNNNQPFTIELNYESANGRTYNDKIVIDLSILAEINDPEPSLPHQLSKVIEKLEDIEKAIKSNPS